MPASRKPVTTAINQAEVYFAGIRAKRLEAQATLPAKFLRMLDMFPLAGMFGNKRVAVKMHLGENLGYSTVHPLFVRLLGEKLRQAGAAPFATDGHKGVREASARGYAPDTIGMPIVPVAGSTGRFFRERPVRYKTLRKIEVAGEILDADAMIVLSHFKGHGDCGYGGACKNIAMGCVTSRTRSDIHHLEGGIVWSKAKCIACRKCVEACPNNAARFNDEKKEFHIFFHHCTYCQHCILACPRGALTLKGRFYSHFMEGMAISTEKVIETFEPGRVLYVNMLLNVTVFCDCWGMTTPSLVPDIGIMASTDMVAADKASLDAVKTENLIRDSLPPGRKLGSGRHLFEKIHGKDPYAQIAVLEHRGLGTSRYRIAEVD